MSRVQVLVATMNQTDYSLPLKMNIQTDAIIGNQCNHNSFEEISVAGNKVFYLSLNEKGVGLNRNNALMRASSEYCIFADDDMVFYDGYEKKVIDEFELNPKADVLIFNIDEENTYNNSKRKKVTRFNYGRYGTVRIAIRLKKIRENSIYFNQLFGGGTEHSSGEDTLFLASCLKCGLNVKTVPYAIAYLTKERESTWFRGYNEKYLEDKGYLFRCISQKWWWVLCLQDATRHYKLYNHSIIETMHLLVKGAKNSGMCGGR